MDWEVAGKDKGKGTASDAASPQKPPQRKGRKMKTWAIVVLVIVVLAIAGKITSCAKDQPSDLDWPTTGLAKMLPEPPTKKGEANTNSAEQLDADIEDCTESQFKDYVESCKDKGFTVDAIEDTDSYTAYTEKSYKLDLCYYGSMEEMSITLDAPIEMGDIAWPTSGSGSYAPAPVSTKGKITSESSDYFTAYVGDTDKAAYSAYVDSCINRHRRERYQHERCRFPSVRRRLRVIHERLLRLHGEVQQFDGYHLHAGRLRQVDGAVHRMGRQVRRLRHEQRLCRRSRLLHGRSSAHRRAPV